MNNQNVKEVMMYRAIIKFEGKFYPTPETESIDEALEYIKRARLKTNSKNLLCNIVSVVRYEPAK